MAVNKDLPSVSKTLRESFGRLMNSTTYGLPSDAEEMDRLSLQHRIWKLMAGGLYPKQAEGLVQGVIKRALNEGRELRIFDVGSGSGIWAVEMARKYPQSQVMGIDLEASRPADIPGNCRFIQGDVLNDLGSEEFAGQFDIVQCRSVAKHVPNANLLMKNIGGIIRPGGIFFFADSVTEVCNERLEHSALPEPDEPYEKSGGKSWFARWHWEATQRWQSKALNNTDGDDLHNLMREDGRFENISTFVYNAPIGWDGDGLEIDDGPEVGNLMGINIPAFVIASKPSFLESGLPQSRVDDWAEKVTKECLDPQKRFVLKWAFNWGTKKL